MRSCYLALAAVGLMAPEGFALAQSAHGTIPRNSVKSEYPHERAPVRRFGSEHGLAHNLVHDLVQDTQGFIWIGTDAGLSRFDGMEFKNFRLNPAVRGSNIFTRLLLDKADNLWVGSATGLLRFDKDTEELVVVSLPIAAGQEAGAFALFEDSQSRIWVGAGNEIFRRDPVTQRFHRVEEVVEAPGRQILEIQAGRDGAFWVLVGDRNFSSLALWQLAENRAERHTLVGPGAQGSGFLIDSRGRFWLGAPWAGVQGSPGVMLAAPDGITAPTLTAVAEGASGTMWIADGFGLYRLEDGEHRATRMPVGDPDNFQQSYARAILPDRAGLVWVGTLGGLFRLDTRQPRFRHVGHDSSEPLTLSGDAVSSLVEHPPGVLWVGTFGAGLNRVDLASGAVERFRHDPADMASLCDDNIWAIHAGSDGRLWLGTVTGVCIFDPVRLACSRISDPAGGRLEGIRTIVEVPSGVLWIGTWDGGLLRFEAASSRWHRFLEAGAEIVAFRRHGPEEAWISGDIDRVTRLELASIRFESHLLSAQGGGQLNLQVLDLYRSPNALWLGTDRGLGRVDPESWSLELPVAAGLLPGSVVYSILADDRGRLWLGTDNGLARFDPKAAAGRRARSFDLQDGIGNVEYNRHAALRLASGEMVFGGMTGLTIFDPTAISDDAEPPPVALTGVRVLGTEGERRVPVHGVESVTLAPTDTVVTFHYAGLDLRRPDLIRYSYRLDGLDQEWILAGTARSVRYTHLPPGDYTFRVRAANRDGRWNQAGAALPLSVLPPFWRTWWFRFGTAVLLVLAIYAAHRFRLAQVRKLERTRLQIAGDLHDELGSDLSAIALTSALMGEEASLSEEDRRRLRDVHGVALKVMHGLRDIVWCVDPEHDSQGALALRMRSVAEQLLSGIDWRFETDLNEDSTPMSIEGRRHLLLFYKEALTNIARHGGAKKVRLRIEREGRDLVLEICDDGRGFDLRKVSAGTGLRNLERRARRLGAQWRLESEPGGGTRILLRAPMTQTRRFQRRSGSGSSEHWEGRDHGEGSGDA